MSVGHPVGHDAAAVRNKFVPPRAPWPSNVSVRTPVTPTLEQVRYVELRLSDWLISAAERTSAALLLIALAPLMLAIGLTTLVISRRWPVIRHDRVGRFGRPLAMLKFRTMWGADIEAPAEKRRDDPRITSQFAAFCRSHSLDELPQLVHVLSGEMSFVGPRPITVHELDEHYGVHTEEVLSARPGLTGLWQVRGRSRLSYARRKRLDLLLVRRASARLYFHILACSVRDICNGRDAW